ncbi:MAG: outer membrane beta-barrel family protein [Bacteroidaceae bacterium]|nr:outer membrane beta-barrel family protein [Bacteroidaceae bacterium]
MGTLLLALTLQGQPICVTSVDTLSRQSSAARPDSINMIHDSVRIDSAAMARMIHLQGATVTAQKRLVKMETDKVTYQIKDDPDAQHSSLLDMMRRVPMVTVDGEDKVSVKGSQAYKVYVDDKPSPFFQNNPSQVMKMLPASQVKDVEVITNPGAKYDADGMVVINIHMKSAADSQMNGTYGTIRLDGNTREPNGSVSVGGQQGKLNYNATASTVYNMTDGLRIRMDRSSWDAAGNETPFSLDLRQHSRTPMTMGNLSMGYQLDSMSTTNLGINFMNFNSRGHGYNNIRLGALDYTERTRSHTRSTNLSVNADYRRYFNHARTHYLTLSYLFSTAPGRSSNFNQPQGLDSIVTRDDHNHSRTLEQTGQIDYVVPLTKQQTLSIGTKYTNRQTRSDADYASTNQEQNYRHQNDILAAYSEYEGTYGKWKTKEGLRLEQTWEHLNTQDGTRIHSDFTSLVPSANLSYNISAMQNIGVTYGMRISRPGISYLNPYRDQTVTGIVSYGNPDLDIVKTHQLGAVYNLFTPKFLLSANLSYDFSSNGIDQYVFYQDGLLNATFGNITKSRNLNLTLFSTITVSPKGKLILNLTNRYTDLRSQSLNAKRSGWTLSGSAGLQQELPWKLQMSAFYFGNSRNYTLQGWSSGFSIGMLSLSKKLMHDRLNVTLQGMSPIGHGVHLVIRNHTSGQNFRNSTYLRIPIARIGLSVTYNFGNLKLRKQSHESSIQSDLIEKQSGTPGIGNVPQAN